MLRGDRPRSVLVPLVGLVIAMASIAAAPPRARASDAPAAKPATKQVAKTAPLGILSPKERSALLPFMEAGPVALVEFSAGEDLPAIVFAARVAAPPAEVAEVIADVGAYPKFMPAVGDVEVLSRVGTMKSYAWKWKTSLFTLEGENILKAYAPPEGREDYGHRITVQSTRGDLGSGRMMWRLYPLVTGAPTARGKAGALTAEAARGATETLLVFSSRLDLRRANWVTKQINTGERSINRTANIALAFAMLRGVTRRAEDRGRVRGPRLSEAPLARPTASPKKLATLLGRGDLLFITMDGDALRQVASVGRTFSRYSKMRSVMSKPEAFGSALVPGSYVRVEKQEGGATDFRWGIDIPLIGTSGKMHMEDRGHVIEIDAVSGAIEGGSWRFEPVKLPWREGAVVSWGRFEPEKASWLIKSLVSGNPDLGHGIIIGSQLMVSRAIRTRSQS